MIAFIFVKVFEGLITNIDRAKAVPLFLRGRAVAPILVGFKVLHCFLDRSEWLVVIEIGSVPPILHSTAADDHTSFLLVDEEVNEGVILIFEVDVSALVDAHIHTRADGLGDGGDFLLSEVGAIAFHNRFGF